MIWLLFVAGSVLLFSAVHITNKHVFSKELNDPYVATVVPSATIFASMALATFFFGFGYVPVWAVVISVVAGILDGAGAFAYFNAIKIGDISRVVPLAILSPVFTIFGAALVLSETFSMVAYAGMILLISGSFMISFDIRNKISFSHAVPVAIAASLIWSLRDLSIKSAATYDVLQLLFWFGLGRLLLAGIIYAKHHPHITKKASKGIHHLMLNGVLIGAGITLYMMALSMESASIVSSFATLQGLAVFILVVAMSHFFPKIVREKHDRKSLALRLAGIIILTIGAVLAVS